jgi:hypothetical protein
MIVWEQKLISCMLLWISVPGRGTAGLVDASKEGRLRLVMFTTAWGDLVGENTCNYIIISASNPFLALFI